MYFSKLPKDTFERDVFYLQPVCKIRKYDQPWFTTTPVGKNSVKDICTDAGVKGNKSNHSLRATGATELHQAGVP